MIIVYSGIIGSGKSYKLVSELFEARKKYFVVHNIDGLEEGFIDCGFDFVKKMEEENIEAKVFFSKEYQAELCKAVQEKYNRNVLVVIDEAGEWFGSQIKSQRLWLAYHRHLGQEIWMVAHRVTDLASIYRSFIEVEWRGKSGSMLFLPGYFFYNRISGGQRAGWKLEKIKPEVFAVYKSSHRKEIKARRSWLVPASLLFAVLALWGFTKIPSLMFHGKVKNEEKTLLKNDASENQAGNGIAEGKKRSSSSAMVKVGGNYRVEENYSFQGNFNGVPVFVENETGAIMRLSGLPGHYMIVSVQGSEYCRLYDLVGRREFDLKNNGRLRIAAERAAERSGAVLSAGGIASSGRSGLGFASMRD